MQFAINDIDIRQLGVTILDGVYDELTKLPEPKDTLVNDWKDGHGKERHLAGRVYKSRQLNMPIIIEGNSRADFLAKKQAFNATMLAGYFTLKCYDLNRQFTLVYTGATAHKDFENFCTLTLVVEDDYPHLNTPIA